MLQDGDRQVIVSKCKINKQKIKQITVNPLIVMVEYILEMP